MTPNILVDIGNSRVKIGRCTRLRIVDAASLPADNEVAWEAEIATWRLPEQPRWAIASVHPARLHRFCEWVDKRGDEFVVINDYRTLPITIKVADPSSVGIDRLLNGLALQQILPEGTPGVIIDVGTAMTVDLLDDSHAYSGGVILPGPRLMFDSLHRHTAKLPFVEIEKVPDCEPPIPAENTKDAITAGVMSALMGATEFLVREYREQFPTPPWVVMTGGAVGGLAGYGFGEDAGDSSFDPHLTLRGIRLAAEALP